MSYYKTIRNNIDINSPQCRSDYDTLNKVFSKGDQTHGLIYSEHADSSWSYGPAESSIIGGCLSKGKTVMGARTKFYTRSMDEMIFNHLEYSLRVT